MDWKPISTAPFDHDLELGVVGSQVHALAFPARRIHGGWVDGATKKRIDVDPTHWREWQRKS
jgi:hypothetical protein